MGSPTPSTPSVPAWSSRTLRRRSPRRNRRRPSSSLSVAMRSCRQGGMELQARAPDSWVSARRCFSLRQCGARMNSMSHLIAGRFEVLEEIGRHAAGITYKVRRTLLDSILTLTVLPEHLTKDPEHRARVRSAVEKATALRHDHIAPVVYLGREEHDHIGEAFVDGERLDRRLRQSGPLPPAQVLHIAGQLADALGYAHARGVVHGALTPASVVITQTVPPRAVL